MALVEVNGVYKSYMKRKSKEKVHAVRHVSFTVNKGEVVGLLGPNGAGKTSTIKMLCGLLKADAGYIRINGLDINKDRNKALEHISAVLEGNRNLYWRLTVMENMTYFAGNRGFKPSTTKAHIEHLLELFNLKHKAHELVSNLSRGMQQKLAIAVALLAKTDVILLDEPTLGLDVEVGYELRQILKKIAKEEQRTIIISSHDMPVIQDLCDRVIIINHGQIVVDDRVDHLLKLFESRAYSISLATNLSEQQQQRFKHTFPLSKYEQQQHQCHLEVNLKKSDDMYELFDYLKTEQLIVESVDRIAVDVEQIFLQVVKEAR